MLFSRHEGKHKRRHLLSQYYFSLGTRSVFTVHAHTLLHSPTQRSSRQYLAYRKCERGMPFRFELPYLYVPPACLLLPLHTYVFPPILLLPAGSCSNPNQKSSHQDACDTWGHHDAGGMHVGFQEKHDFFDSKIVVLTAGQPKQPTNHSITESQNHMNNAT